jgi:hypothetical protein
MVVKMKTGGEYIISDERGAKLQQLLTSGALKQFINLDGRGMMVKPELIEKVYSEHIEQTPKPMVEAWKLAIKHNLQLMRETGHMGHTTAEDFLTKTAVVTG